MRLSLVATTLFAALPALAASQPANADGAVARGMGHTVNSRRAAHRAFAHRGGDGERRGPNGKKCRPKHGKGSKGANAGSGSTATTAAASGGTGAAAGNDSGDQSQNWIGQDSNQHNGDKQDSTSTSGSITSSASSAGVSPSGAAGNSTSVGHEFYQSETSSTVSSGSSSATSSTATGAAPSPPSTEGAEGATTSTEGAHTSSSASPSPSPSPSADGGNNSGGDNSGGNNNSGGGGLSWLNGADPNPGANGGEASYYDVQSGATYCGGHFSNDDNVIALSTEYWNQITGGGYSTGPPCGKKIKITWNGVTKTGVVQDQCPVCAPGKLDLAEGFWKSFTGGDGALGILGLQDKPENGQLTWVWDE